MKGSRLIADYLTMAGGSLGRIVISLAYFLIAANVLSLGDFGMFATASAAGVVLSRVASFGFVSPLFRAATVRRRLTGIYLAGYFLALTASLPLVIAIAAGLKPLVFPQMPLMAFALVIAAEVLGWRLLEVVAIINNGQRRFVHATALVLLGAGIRTLGALAFWLLGHNSLIDWAWTYLAVNALCALVAFLFFLPKLRLRLAPALYLRQMRDALPAAMADITFYVQAELDKAVVLMMAGPRVAGLYAIAMRVIDLTALPIRSFNQLIMQKIMTERRVALGGRLLALVEVAIAVVSVAGLGAVAALLWWKPDLLGRNIASVAPLLPLLLAVPAFRNLVEYHAELLYGMERTGVRAGLLALIAALKAALIWLALRLSGTAPEASGADWAPLLNLVFLALYAVSALVAYRVIRNARKPA
jgi:O-antigen/teichoic acid export membrane protein